jgi:translation elongation factor EF-G
LLWLLLLLLLLLQVLFKQGEDGRRLEPLEEVALEVDAAQVGTLIEALTARRGELKEVGPVAHAFGSSSSTDSGSGTGTDGGSSSGSERQRLVFEVPARGMIGFKSFFAGVTRGEGLMTRAFARYALRSAVLRLPILCCTPPSSSKHTTMCLFCVSWIRSDVMAL